MNFIISIVFSILISYIVYKCFEKYGFKIGAIAQIIIIFIQDAVKNVNGSNFLGLMIISIITGLIGAGINYLIYLHSNSFVGYLLLSILIGFIISAVGTVVAASILVGSLV